MANPPGADAILGYVIHIRRATAADVEPAHASRVDAHRFYQRLGFAQSHLGFKLML